MTTQQILLMDGLYLAFLAAAIYFTRATARRIVGALAGGAAAGLLGLGLIALGEAQGWWPAGRRNHHSRRRAGEQRHFQRDARFRRGGVSGREPLFPFPTINQRSFLMFTRIAASHFYCSLLLLVLAASPLLAQDKRWPGSPAVTAAASAEQVRFTAPAEVYHLRLEVFDARGPKVFDSDFKLGNLLDWPLLDQQGARLADGAYRCLVTTRTLAGQLSQKHGLLVLQAGLPALQPPGAEAQAIQPANPLASIGREDFLTLLGELTNLPLTLLAHDGERGQLVSGRGGLSFRTGDFFAGKDVEQMRLTAEGKLGLGVSDPQAKLDVGGLIRTSEGILFPDGSIQTTAYLASGRSLSERSQMQRDTAGRGLAELAEPAQKNSAGRTWPTQQDQHP